MNILRPHLAGVKTFMEIAPGDCRLAYEMCQHVEKVIALDISDQSGGQQNAPKNFHFETYDGYTLNLPDNSVDLAFSYQFLEHVHPDDHEDHFRTVLRVLRPGGAYIFDTPHKYSGPHDASFIFADEAEGMHLKEWTYREMDALVRRPAAGTEAFTELLRDALDFLLLMTAQAFAGPEEGVPMLAGLVDGNSPSANTIRDTYLDSSQTYGPEADRFSFNLAALYVRAVYFLHKIAGELEWLQAQKGEQHAGGGEA